MEFTPRAAELLTLLENRIINYYTDLKVDVFERVVSVGDGIARVYGLNEIQAGEMVEFASGVKGIALNLVSIVLGNYSIVIFVLLLLFWGSVYTLLGKRFWIFQMNPVREGSSNIPDLNLPAPNSDTGSGSEENTIAKLLKRLKGRLSKIAFMYCTQVCKNQRICRPKCPSEMNEDEKSNLLETLTTRCNVENDRRKINYFINQTYGEDLREGKPLRKLFDNTWSWDD